MIPTGLKIVLYCDFIGSAFHCFHNIIYLEFSDCSNIDHDKVTNSIGTVAVRLLSSYFQQIHL